MTRFMLALAAFGIAAAPVQAAGEVSLASNVLVERQVAKADGTVSTTLEQPGLVTPGDKLVFAVSYANRTKNPANDFVVTNPIPQSVAFAGDASAGAQLSVDGGKNWGELASLKVANTDGTFRAAVQADVTHVRWTFAEPIKPGAEGKVSFRAVVR